MRKKSINRKIKATGLILGLLAVTALASVSVLAIMQPSKQDTQPLVKSTSSTAAKEESGRKLVMSDEFNGTALNETLWNKCYDSYSIKYEGCSNTGNFESEWYTANQVTESGGNLVLTAEKKTTKGLTAQGYEYDYPYTSGMVTSGRRVKEAPAKWSRTYGYYEARMNVPDGQAVWPAFWLLPVSRKWPPEIDVMELLGNKPNELLTTYHWPGPENQGQPKDSSTYTSPTSLAGSWHVYGVDWQKGSIKWYLDGKLIKESAGENVPAEDMQIIFNLAIGGTLPGSPDETTPAKTSMLVDYVRVYE